MPSNEQGKDEPTPAASGDEATSQSPESLVKGLERTLWLAAKEYAKHGKTVVDNEEMKVDTPNGVVTIPQGKQWFTGTPKIHGSNWSIEYREGDITGEGRNGSQEYIPRTSADVRPPCFSLS